MPQSALVLLLAVDLGIKPSCLELPSCACAAEQRRSCSSAYDDHLPWLRWPDTTRPALMWANDYGEICQRVGQAAHIPRLTHFSELPDALTSLLRCSPAK
jgi:hypothetical protein